ncbi:UNVERIFIED_CONTAM: hypothetical protein K2H54_011704 [Gekko kuhli]
MWRLRWRDVETLGTTTLAPGIFPLNCGPAYGDSMARLGRRRERRREAKGGVEPLYSFKMKRDTSNFPSTACDNKSKGIMERNLNGDSEQQERVGRSHRVFAEIANSLRGGRATGEF